MVTKIHSLVFLGFERKIGTLKLDMMKYFFFGLLLLINLFIFYPLFSIFFAADDFFVLYQVQTSNFTDFLKLFIPHPEVVYYRPLGIQFYFWLINKIFGLNPVAFHLIAFLFHFSNAILVYLAVKKLSKDETVAKLASLFWSASAIHFLSLAWIVNFSFILVSFFYFLTLLSWLEVKFLQAYLSFFLGIVSNELILTLPVLLVFYELVYRKTKFQKFFKKMTPLFLTLVFYLLIRFFLPGRYEGVYVWQFNKKILSTLRWYILWGLGWAETMKDQMETFYSIRDKFYGSFFKEALIFVNSLFIFLTLFIILPFIFLLLEKFTKVSSFFSQDFRLLFFSFFSFFLSLAPVLFTPDHIYPHYLTIASLWLYFPLIFFFIKVFKLTKKEVWLRYFFTFSLLICWLLVSCTTVRLNMKVHWLPRHAGIAKAAIFELRDKLNKLDYKQLKRVFIVSHQKERKLSLAEDKAIKVFFGRDLQVFYPQSKTKELENFSDKLYNEDWLYRDQTISL